MSDRYRTNQGDENEHRWLTSQTDLEEDNDSEERPICPDCGTQMLYGFDYEIENDLLYEASGHRDGIATIEWFECPGCGYIDK